jgi:hypothetical protein
VIVYIVEGGWDYDGSCIQGVFHDRESAKRKVEELERDGGYDYVTVTGWEVER